MFFQVAKLACIKECPIAERAGFVLDVGLILVDHWQHFYGTMRTVDILLVPVLLSDLDAAYIDHLGSLDLHKVILFQHVEPESLTSEATIDLCSLLEQIPQYMNILTN